MRDPFVRASGAALAVAASLAAWTSCLEFHDRSLLDRYRSSAKVDYRQDGTDPEATVSARVSLLLEATRWTSVAPEVQAAAALEMVNAANAHLLAGHTDSVGEAAVSIMLREGLAHVRSALSANPTDTRAWLAGYRVLESARLLGRPEIMSGTGPGRGGDASAFLAGAIGTNPNSGDLRHGLATIMVASGNLDGASEQYRFALLDPSVDGVEVAREMLEAHYAAEDVLMAMPARFHDQFGVGELLLEAGRLDLAERAFLQARTRLPTAPEPWIALSRLAESRGQHDDALAYARGAFPLFPSLNPSARSELLLSAARASRSLGDTPTALSYGAQALKENPQNLFLYNFLASLLYERREFEGAIRYWEILLDEYASDAYVRQYAGLFHRAVGYSYLEIGETERAMHSFLSALQLDPEDHEAQAALGRLAGKR